MSSYEQCYEPMFTLVLFRIFPVISCSTSICLGVKLLKRLYFLFSLRHHFSCSFVIAEGSLLIITLIASNISCISMPSAAPVFPILLIPFNI